MRPPWARVAAGILILGGTAGCATHRRQPTGRVVEQIQVTRSASEAARSQIANTLELLDGLVNAPQEDLRPVYARVKKEQAAIGVHSARAAEEATALREAAYAYNARWDDYVATTEDPTMQALRAQSQQAIRADFEVLDGAARQVREAYWPVIKNLEGIVQHLGQDLTADGVEAIRAQCRQAAQDARDLDQRIGALIGDLDRVARSLIPGSP